VQLQPREGPAFPAALMVVPVKGAEGKGVGLRWSVRDITAQKAAEEAIAQNAALQAEIRARQQTEAESRRAKNAAEAADRAKSEFLATMSHELRTPLTVILGYNELLLDGEFGPLPEPQEQVVRRSDQNARGLLELINMVLDVNRLDSGRLPVEVHPVQVPTFLQELQHETQGLQDLSGLAFVWQVEEGLPVLHTDAAKLKLVLKNLVSNAVKFTKTGTVTIAARAEQAGVEISVTDTGIGIAPAMQDIIFERFRQGRQADSHRYGGSGLGLYIVKQLLELLGGRVSVESQLGEGSTFRVWAPIAGPRPIVS
jgi:signal transduction histidine kinase